MLESLNEKSEKSYPSKEPIDSFDVNASINDMSNYQSICK